MSTIRAERILLTVPSGRDVGLAPDVVTARQGRFDGLIVGGVDVTEDVADFSTHIASASGVHGATGNVVGTTDAQVLTNKTIVGGANGNNITANLLTGGITISGSPTTDQLLAATIPTNASWV